MSRASRWIGLAGVALALVGVWGAWVPHRATALRLSGWDLAEYLKFVPGADVPRDLFYWPVWCAAIALGLCANQRVGESASGRRDRWLWRVVWVGVALGLMVVILPPYPDTLTGFRSTEHRWRFALGTSGLLLVLLTLTSRRWPKRLVGGLLVALACFGSLPALWQFLQVRNELEAVYGGRIGWGWGLVVFFLGWVVVSIVGGRLAKGLGRSK